MTVAVPFVPGSTLTMVRPVPRSLCSTSTVTSEPALTVAVSSFAFGSTVTVTVAWIGRPELSWPV